VVLQLEHTLAIGQTLLSVIGNGYHVNNPSFPGTETVMAEFMACPFYILEAPVGIGSIFHRVKVAGKEK
jgi:hypothetical protein